jgi:hypothetical protein
MNELLSEKIDNLKGKMDRRNNLVQEIEKSNVDMNRGFEEVSKGQDSMNLKLDEIKEQHVIQSSEIQAMERNQSTGQIRLSLV